MTTSRASARAMLFAAFLFGPVSTGEAQAPDRRAGRPSGSEISYLDRYHPAVVAERGGVARPSAGDSLHGARSVEPMPAPPTRRKSAQQYFPGMRPGTYTNAGVAHHCNPSRGGMMARAH